MRSSNPSPFFSFTFRVSDASTTFPLGPFGQHGQYSSVQFHKLRTHPSRIPITPADCHRLRVRRGIPRLPWPSAAPARHRQLIFPPPPRHLSSSSPDPTHRIPNRLRYVLSATNWAALPRLALHRARRLRSTSIGRIALRLWHRFRLLA